MVGLEPSELAVDSSIQRRLRAAGRRRAGARWTAESAASNALCGRGWEGHTARVPHGSCQPPRLAAVGPHPGRRQDTWLGGVQGASVHLDRGYDSERTRRRLQERGLIAEVSEKGRPAPLNVIGRWVVERTNSWQNAHKKLLWCTERRGRVVDFWVALSEVIIIVRRLVREGWRR
jgi:hypothetical protein